MTRRRKLAYAIICVAATLLVVEGALRLRAWIRYGTAAPNVPDEMLVYDKDADLRIPRAGFERTGAKTHIKINSLGFRGDDFAQEKPPRSIRIVCLGASTTFCAEVSSNSATWPARLQSLLQAKHPDNQVEVINAGIPGCVVAGSLKNLEHRILPLCPDLVIFYEANNDMAIDTRDLARDRGVIGTEANYRSGFSKFLSERSLLFDLATKNLMVLLGRRDSREGKLTELPSDLPARFVSRLQEMHDRLSERHIPLVLSCFLTKYRRNQPRDVQLANADVAFYYMPWMTIDSLLDGIDLYNDAIVKFAHEQQIPVVEDRSGVPGNAAHFADFTHMTDAGCDAMAIRFAGFLEEKALVKPVARDTEINTP